MDQKEKTEEAGTLDHIATDVRPGDAGGAGSGGDAGTGGSVGGIGTDTGGNEEPARQDDTPEHRD